MRQLTNMQNYRTKHLAEIAIAHLSTPDRVLHWSLGVSNPEDSALVKMETPTPLSREDRRTMEAPLEHAVTWPSLDSSVNANLTESTSSYQDLGDIIHNGVAFETNDPSHEAISSPIDRSAQSNDVDEHYPTIPPDPAAHSPPVSSRADGKRRIISACKDEWDDSSEDDEVTRVHRTNDTTSEYFQPERRDATAQHPRKKAKAARKKTNPGYHKMSGTGHAAPKILSMSRMLHT